MIVKSVEKKMLQGNELAQEYAKRECLVHSKLRNHHIIRMFDYSELEKRYVFFLEYAGDNSDYLAVRIGQLGKPIKDQD